jgi:ABC-type polysaccharide/polyol phosphate export permease
VAASALASQQPVRAGSRLSAIFARRQLLLTLVQKEFETRYAGSTLGLLWTQLYPLLLLGVYSIVFSLIFHTDIQHFPIFLFIGIIIWNFFSTATQLSTNSIVANSGLVTKVAFPRELLTISVVAMALIDLALSHVILLVGALASGVRPAWTWLCLPVLVLLLAMFANGLGLMLASAAVYLRDVKFFVDVGVLLMMFLSPVFYSDDSVPRSLAWLMLINPLAIVIGSYRRALLYGIWPAPVSWTGLVLAAGLMLWLGLEIFARAQRGFANAL